MLMWGDDRVAYRKAMVRKQFFLCLPRDRYTITNTNNFSESDEQMTRMSRVFVVNHSVFQFNEQMTRMSRVFVVNHSVFLFNEQMTLMSRVFAVNQ